MINTDTLLASRRAILSLAVFCGAAALYLFSSAPALAPYRDMGEMVSVSKTLGVAHPPGYPAYTLTGKISTLVPFANFSYRVNLASVVGGALAAMLFFDLLGMMGLSLLARVFALLIWCGCAGVWTVCVVTEMYSLNLAAGMFILWLCARCENEPADIYLVYACALAAGFLTGFRLDLVLALPGLILWSVYLLYRGRNAKHAPRVLGICALFMTLGFSIYLYLLVRSNTHPLLNWNRPETFQRLYGSITRKTHGGTLDLLATNYEAGALFWTDFKIYLADFAEQFRWIGAPLALWGLFSLARKRTSYFILTFAGWFFSAPFFIYKANMPPNPHALAVLEAHFLFPHIFTSVWIAYGAQELFANVAGTTRKALTVLVLCIGAFHLYDRWTEVSKRGNYFGVDYGRNMLTTLPPDAALIMQKDVQLFTFWALQYAENKRPDLLVVARGLSGSPWYIQMREENGVRGSLGPLKSEDDFVRFLTGNPGRRVFIGMEEDFPNSTKYRFAAYGLLREIALAESNLAVKNAARPDFLRDFYVYRGDYRYQRQHVFFNQDLIDEYGKAHFARALELVVDPSGVSDAHREWGRSLTFNTENAPAYYRRAFTFFQQNRMDLAERDFRRAEKIYENTFALTQKYHSLSDVVGSVRNEWSDALLNWGVSLEKLGDKEKAASVYEKALSVQPNTPNAHYNLAVIYWNRDWDKVVYHLRECLRLDPNNAMANAFLPKALYAQQHFTGGTPRP